MITLGAWERHRQPVLQRLSELARWMEGRGFGLEIGQYAASPYVFFACRPAPGAADAGWTPILRSQLGAAMAETLVGPLTTRWLSRLLVRQARACNYPLTPAARGRAVEMARGLVEAPPGEHAAPLPDPESRAAGSTTNLLRWQARLARSLVEALAAFPQGVVVEAIAYFGDPSYVRALRQAAAAVVAELAGERREQRASAPWRSLWFGPPPRAYEVHLFQAPDGTYHVLDRWGAPAGRRWLGDQAGGMASEELVVGHLVRLGPRRIVVHLPDEAPVQAAVRAAFPGRVHTCRGCPRCLAGRRTHPAPTPSR